MGLMLLIVVAVGAIVVVAGIVVLILVWLLRGSEQPRHREAPHESAAPTTESASPGWLREAIEEASPPAPATAAYNPGFTPLSPQELAAHFPQLEILELLGKGGMGAVYKARQPHLDRLVALKVLPPDAARDSAFAERFAREARALARLNHPHIVTVHDFGESGGLFFLLMEFVDGVNLRQAMRSGQLTPQEALRIVPQLCEALQFAHDEGVVHRDIKPENILLDKRGRVKVADFGLAKLLGHVAGDVSLTGTQQVMGTMNYMAPEQLAGARAVDHRADIYSLGVTFYEMLTRELPLGRFPPPSKTAGVDVRLDHVVLRTLEREPADRYQQASDVKTDVESIARDAAPAHPAAVDAPPSPSRALGVSWPRVCAIPVCLVGAAMVFAPWMRLQVEGDVAHQGLSWRGIWVLFYVFGHELWQGWATAAILMALACVAVATCRQRAARWPGLVLLLGGIAAGGVAADALARLPIPAETPQLRPVIHHLRFAFPDLPIAGKTDVQFIEEASREHNVVLERHASFGAATVLILAAVLVVLASADLQRTARHAAKP